MYRLYYDSGTASMAPHAALEEIGAPYELVHVDLAAGENRQPAYLAVNPRGEVPTLVDGETVVVESHAILLLLADRHRAAALAPSVEDPARGPFLSWLFWLTGSVQNTFLHFRYPHYYVGGEDAGDALSRHAERRLMTQFAWIEERLAGGAGPYILGPRFSVADISLAMLARWSRWASTPGFSHPHVRRLVDAVAARPAYRRTLEQEGIEALA